MTRTEWLIGVGICMLLLAPIWLPLVIADWLISKIGKALTCSASH